MKTFKRILSLVLTVCLVASVAVIATVSASANAGDPIRRPNIKDVVNKDPDLPEVSTFRYYFYLPEAWKNVYNDSYDGTDLESCSAGVYWWTGSYKPDDYKGELTNAWPGYVVTDRETADSNIFYADVPDDVNKIVFNDAVDGGMDEEADVYNYAFQTIDIPSEMYDAGDDKYGFYPDGLDDFDGMIFVTDPDAISKNELSGKTSYGGNWFFYYGDGTYGIYETKAEAEAADAVLSGGQFPKALQIDPKNLTLYYNEPTEKSATITPNDPTAVASIADDTVASLVQDPTTGVATVTALVAEGETTVSFIDASGLKRTANVTVTSYPSRFISFTAAKTTIKIGDTTKTTAKINYPSGKTTYTTSKKTVATVDSKGVIKGVGTGKATITAKNGRMSKTVEITVKKADNPMVVKFTKTVNANSKKNVTATVAKVSKAQGKVTYKVTGNSKVSIKNGKLTIKKGLKKGKTVKVKVTVTAAGTSKYDKGTKSETITIKVK